MTRSEELELIQDGLRYKSMLINDMILREGPGSYSFDTLIDHWFDNVRDQELIRNEQELIK